MPILDSVENEPEKASEKPHKTLWGWRDRTPIALILVAGVVVFGPSLGAPRFLDDHLHATMIAGTFPASRGPADLYDFVDDGDRDALRERGLLPWWAESSIKIRFFRPLSSAMRWGEERALGGSQVILHLHSIAWWMLAVLAAYALYRKAFSKRVTLMATIMFGLAPAHSIPITWLANREALVSLALGTFALAQYRTFRLGGGVRHALLATLGFGVAMLGGEYALCIGGYVVAFELAGPLPRAPLARALASRALGVLPFALPAAAYLFARARLAYGSAGSGFYSDPLHDPAAYLHTAPWRFASLVGNAWLGVDTSTWLPAGPRTTYLVLLGLAIPVVALVIARALRGLDTRTRSDATWLTIGSFLSLLPVLSVLPSTRLLGVVGLGVSPVIALLLEHAWFPETPPPRRGLAELTGIVALLLAFAHLVQGPVNAFLGARTIRRSAIDFAWRAGEVHRRLAPDPERSVIVLRGSGRSFFLPFALDPHRLPRSWSVLADAGHVLVLRTDERTLELHSTEGESLFPQQVGDLFRTREAVLHPGDELRGAGFTATVLAANENGATVARFVFDTNVDDPSILWLNDRRDGIEPFTPPELGLGAPVDP